MAPRRGRVSLQMVLALALMLGSLVLTFAFVAGRPLSTYVFEALFFVGLGWVLWILFTSRGQRAQVR